jgi:hypothetical protein
MGFIKPSLDQLMKDAYNNTESVSVHISHEMIQELHWYTTKEEYQWIEEEHKIPAEKIIKTEVFSETSSRPILHITYNR